MGAVKVTAKAEYAVRAMLELATSEEGLLKGERIARRQGIPLKFLENILVDLRHADLVHAQRGAEGGYRLAREPEDITLGQVIRAVEGPLASVRGEPPERMAYEGSSRTSRESGSQCARACDPFSTASRWPTWSPAGCRSTCGASSRRRTPGSDADRLRLGAQPDRLALVELELLRLAAGGLDPGRVASPRESSTRTSKPRWTMRSTRASAALSPGSSRISTSWGRMKRPDSSLTGPTKRMTNSLEGFSYRSRGARSARSHRG